MADQTLSQEEKNKKLEELADQMVEGTEGVATSSGRRFVSGRYTRHRLNQTCLLDEESLSLLT